MPKLSPLNELQSLDVGSRRKRLPDSISESEAAADRSLRSFTKRCKLSDSTSKENSGVATRTRSMSLALQGTELTSRDSLLSASRNSRQSRSPLRSIILQKTGSCLGSPNQSNGTCRKKLVRRVSSTTHPPSFTVPQRELRSSRRSSIDSSSSNISELYTAITRENQAPSEATVEMSHPSPTSSVETDRMLTVCLSQIFSPRRYTSVGKNQAANLKRLNTRRIEFSVDPHIDESSSLNNTLEDSILNQSFVGDPKERLLEFCGQSEVKPFASHFDAETLEEVVKIGEGVYGEVFQVSKGGVIKIFPVDGDVPVNNEKQMNYYRVYPEVFVSRKLTDLGFKYRQNRSTNFVQLRRATVVYGKLPSEFVAAWHKYKTEKGSDNECLDFLSYSQEWMVLEFDYAGQPLATLRFNTCREARSVIEQLTLSLAAAECALQFEHRDLHWLNVLVRPTRQTKLRYRVDGVSYSVQTEGIQVSIIDFTVSRLCHEGNIVYVDMSNSPEIFECEGDYQFEIYRMMRTMNGNMWRPFRPITNLYWLHYLMDKLLNETSYPRKDPDSRPVESELRALHDSVLSGEYQSSAQLVKSSFYFDTCRID